MNTLEINASVSTPAILYREDGKLLIKGRSIPVNEVKFYNPLIDWAGNLDVSKLTVEINLEYMNSGSSKMLFSLLKTLDINTRIRKLVIKWFYEVGDEAAYAKGKVYSDLLWKAEFRFCMYRDAS